MFELRVIHDRAHTLGYSTLLPVEDEYGIDFMGVEILTVTVNTFSFGARSTTLRDLWFGHMRFEAGR
jgi:hypothetical protein